MANGNFIPGVGDLQVNLPAQNPNIFQQAPQRGGFLSPRASDALLAFGSTLSGSNVFQSVMAQRQNQQAARVSAAQLALEKLPADHPARQQAAQILQDSGVGFLADALQPAQPAPQQPESFSLSPGQARFTGLPGQPAQEIARNLTRPSPVAQTQISIGDGFGAKGVEKQLEGLISGGLAARGAEADFLQLGELISSPQVQTGSLQPAVTSLQGIAADLGINLNNAASGLGIKLGDLSRKQDFNRLSRRVLIQSFEQFKGNLNSREVQIAEDSVAALGTSEDANIDAIAAGMAAQRLARDRAQLAASADTASEARGLLRRVIGEDTGEFIALKNKISNELRNTRAGTNQGLPPGVPAGSKLIRSEPKRVFETPDGRFLIEE